MSPFSKIFEKTVNNQLVYYLEENNIFTSTQFGFREKIGTSTAVRGVVDCVSGALDGSQRPVGVLCDLSKAFDCVDHDILTAKLSQINIQNNELKWFKSYLENRKQKIAINKQNNKFYSDWQTVRYGVPQGSVLGPTLFLVYVNDLHKSTDMEIIQYADDTTLICSHVETEPLWKCVEDGFTSIFEWFSINGLSLNISKTQVIEFSAKPNNHITEVNLGNFSIFTQKNVSFLGLTIDSNLNWKEHITILKKRLHSAIFSIRTLSRVVSLKSLLTVYHAYFESIMSYGLMFWGDSSQSTEVFILQKKVIRLMAKVPNRSSCRNCFKNLKVLTMYSQFIFQLAVMVKQNLKTFMESQVSHNYITRYKNVIKPVTHNLRMYEKSPQYMGPKVFNKLPPDFHSINNIEHFKKELKKWLLDRPYYTLSEFFDDELL